VIRVTGARFVAAASDAGHLPERADPAVGVAPEVAFVGRSNAGKSSLINALVGRRGLARTSATPGRTRQLHVYVVESPAGAVVFVDLPGYGYARVSKAERAGWNRLVEGYLAARPLLRVAVLVVDARRGIEAAEVEVLDYLRCHRRPVLVAATKLDKLGRSAAAEALRQVGAAAHGATVVGVSATTRAGCDELWRRLAAPPISVFASAHGPTK
jgi:GTP-binding protein